MHVFLVLKKFHCFKSLLWHIHAVNIYLACFLNYFFETIIHEQHKGKNKYFLCTSSTIKNPIDNNLLVVFFCDLCLRTSFSALKKYTFA